MEVKGTARQSDGVFAVKERCVVCHNTVIYITTMLYCSMDNFRRTLLSYYAIFNEIFLGVSIYKARLAGRGYLHLLRPLTSNRFDANRPEFEAAFCRTRSTLI